MSLIEPMVVMLCCSLPERRQHLDIVHHVHCLVCAGHGARGRVVNSTCDARAVLVGHLRAVRTGPMLTKMLGAEEGSEQEGCAHAVLFLSSLSLCAYTAKSSPFPELHISLHCGPVQFCHGVSKSAAPALWRFLRKVSGE